MSNVARKILAVRRDETNEYRFMVEYDNRTYSFQTDQREGDELQSLLARTILEWLSRGIARGRVKKND